MIGLRSLSEIRIALRNGSETCENLLETCWARADGLTGCVVWRPGPADRQDLLARAAEASARWTAGTNRPLDGIPVMVKDNFVQRDVISSAGSRALAGYQPPSDAAVVAGWRSAGALFVGRTNMDEFGMGASTTTGYQGPAVHPHNDRLSTGGSSGGSAAVVAAGACAGALGSDTGGSIRQPAALCGVLGVKPSYGALSRRGLIAYASSLDTPGLFAQNARDAALLLDALAPAAVADPADATCDPDNVSGIGSVYESIFSSSLSSSPNGLIALNELQLGVAKDLLLPELSADCRQSLASAVDFLSSTSGSASPSLVNLCSGIDPATVLAAYHVIAAAEASSNLARYDGLRYGLRALEQTTAGHDALPDDGRGGVDDGDDNVGEDLEALVTASSRVKATRTAGFGDEVQCRILLGTLALSRDTFDRFYKRALIIRQQLINGLNDRVWHRGVDVIVAPVTPQPTLPLDQAADDPLQLMAQDIMTVAASLAGLPALSVPLYVHDNGSRSTSVQLIGPRHSDKQLLYVADKLMEQFTRKV